MGTTRAPHERHHVATRPQPVHLHLLSGFELVVDGAPVDVPTSAQRVVAYLALHGRPQPRASVASCLWIDLTEERATANLRAALWKLQDLRDRVVTTRANHVGLAADVTVDVATVVRAAREVLDAGPDVAGHTDLDLLSRDLLPDWDEDWILFERERLRQLRIHAMEAMSAQLRRCGRLADAVEAALAAVAADPLRESAQRALIEAHLAEGNLSDARRQYESFRRVLADDLGVDPSPALGRLVGLASPDGVQRPH